MRRLLYLVALSMVIGLVFAPVALTQSRGPSGADGTYNCEDFDSQAQAQAYYEAQGGLAGGDPDGLDADSDGSACEDYPYGTATPTAGPTDEDSTDPVASTVTGAQYDQYAPVQPVEPAPVEPALPDTGGPALLIPFAGLLLAIGLCGMRLVRRS